MLNYSGFQFIKYWIALASKMIKCGQRNKSETSMPSISYFNQLFSSCSLWNARFYPIAATREESINHAIEILQVVQAIRKNERKMLKTISDFSLLRRESIVSCIPLCNAVEHIDRQRQLENEIVLYTLVKLYKEEINVTT